MNVSVPIPGHSYDIVIERGGLNQVGDWLHTLWGDKKVAIISDNRVAKLYASIVEKSLEKAGFQVVRFEFLQGEASKNLTTVSKVYDFLATQGMTRSDGIVALGGGVVGDLAGFAASTYMRGISFVQIPTSLTAQVDSSIGGKTGVNTALAKNMVGTFAQPDGVFIDPEVLSTLGQRELIEGMGGSHQVRPHPRYGTLGRIGSHGWFCPEYFEGWQRASFPILGRVKRRSCCGR